jgi:hypothetical protein
MIVVQKEVNFFIVLVVICRYRIFVSTSNFVMYGNFLRICLRMISVFLNFQIFIYFPEFLKHVSYVS